MISLQLDNQDLAKTYDAISDSQFENGRRLIEALAVAPGNVVLDIGCGTGRLAFHVADQVGPTGRVIGLDPLPERIALAREKYDHPRISFQTGLAEDLSFLADESVDIVYLSAVFHWVPDKERALAEIRRVLRPGGRIGLTTNAKEFVHATTLRLVTAKVLGRPPYRDNVDVDHFAPTHFGVTTTELVELFQKADLTVAQLQVSRTLRRYRSGSEIVAFAESSTFGNYLNHVPEPLRQSARRELAAEFAQLGTPDGIPFQLYSLLAWAEKEGQA
ncbi:methyltransferase domain-containing protein [Geomonas sp. Red875]|uniref:Methyltransferase domain-containing protein n=2 Tax=Geomesophilobacter sediminis TaxID=2798584 RepID=A0A8J7M3B4_9BACT|nr:methyltransferase domain-containing protein [Geomesophilobacter sediminis]